MASRLICGSRRDFGVKKLLMSAAPVRRPPCLSLAPIVNISAPRAFSTSWHCTAAATEPSSSLRRPKLGRPPMRRPVKKSTVQATVEPVPRVVKMVVHASTTRSDIAQSIAKAAPVGKLSAITFKPLDPWEKKLALPPTSRLVNVLFVHEDSAAQFLKAAAPATDGTAPPQFLLNGKPVEEAWIGTAPPVSEEAGPLAPSRVVLICTPRGHMPREEDIRQLLSEKGERSPNFESEPVFVWELSEVDGVPEGLEFMEWRFFTYRRARAFKKTLCRTKNTNVVRFRPDTYCYFGADPCSGKTSVATNQQYVVDAVVDLMGLEAIRKDKRAKREAERLARRSQFA